MTLPFYLRFHSAGPCCLLMLAVLWPPLAALAQSVCLPAPRLLTTMPMGGRAGSQFTLTIQGENIDRGGELHFSHPGITANPQLDAHGRPRPNRYLVSIAADTPADIYEARVMTRLGLSSSRVFTVGSLPEVARETPNTSLDSACELQLNSVCNAVTSPRAVDYYAILARKDQRLAVTCAARGIDSKLTPVVILSDAQGNDSLVERRGGTLDFTVPRHGRYIIKVHDLTFQGGSSYFYRLAVQQIAAGAPLPRYPATRTVSSFSWPPVGLPPAAACCEQEPNNTSTEAQQLTLPCDVGGRFFPAADVDTFEFTARKGDVWWVEVGSARLGLPTDPSIFVQHVDRRGGAEELTDVAELTDLASPLKPSSNRYSYDGPPYDGGSSDILAKLEIQRDGRHRLQLRDLFGGTRSEPSHEYRLVIRKAAPDFALVAWALHMELRNGDRNALSKPIALRGGSTIALEVATVRRDGFDGAIELEMDNLPEGVTATGLKIPAGKSRGIMLVTARQDAPRGWSRADFYGRAEIGGETVLRRCYLASMAWPVTDAWREIPHPRLLADVPVSVSGSELAPITIAPREQQVWEAQLGQRLTIPLLHTLRCEFSGTTIGMRTLGVGFEGLSRFELPLNERQSAAVLDLATLKTPPGEYRIAFYGGAVAKYQSNPEAVRIAEIELQRRQQQAEELALRAQRLTTAAQRAAADQKADAERQAAAAQARQAAAVAAVQEALKQLQSAQERAKPRDTAEIVVSEPILIRVKQGDTK